MNMTKQKFAGVLTTIRTHGAKLDAAIAQAVEYCAHHHRESNNKEPWTRLESVCLESAKFALPMIRAAKTKVEEARKEGATVEGIVDTAKAELEARRETAKAKAKEKAARAKVEKEEKAKAEKAIAGEVVEEGAYYAMVTKTAAGHSSQLVLTPEEWEVAINAIHAMRQGTTEAVDSKAA